MTTAAEIELMAIALYESACRERAGDMARRTTLSRVRAHYDFPAWVNIPARERSGYRASARKMIAECVDWITDEEPWLEETTATRAARP